MTDFKNKNKQTKAKQKEAIKPHQKNKQTKTQKPHKEPEEKPQENNVSAYPYRV